MFTPSDRRKIFEKIGGIRFLMRRSFVEEEKTQCRDRATFFGVTGVVVLGIFWAIFFVVRSPLVIGDHAALLEERSRADGLRDRSSPLREVPFPFERPIEPIFADRNCSIDSYGAKEGDDDQYVEVNTVAFRDAIADCASSGGGRIIVPIGIWHTGGIRLRDGINLHVESGARLIFTDDPKAYLPGVFSRFEGTELINYAPLIYGYGLRDVGITGEGTLVAKDSIWSDWKELQTQSVTMLVRRGDDDVPVAERDFAREGEFIRPSFIGLVECQNVLIEGVTILESPSWTLHLTYVEGATVRNVEVYTEKGNTDGIAIDSSRMIEIRDSLFDAGDDAIVVKSGKDRDGRRVGRPSENIVIHDCVVGNGHGGIAFGSEMSGDIRNVFVYGIDIRRSDFGIRFKTARGRGGIVEDIFVEDITIRRAEEEGIQIDMEYAKSFRKNDLNLPLFRNISIRNVSIDSARIPYHFVGMLERPMTGVVFSNVHIVSDHDGIFSYVPDGFAKGITITSLSKKKKERSKR